MSKKANEIFDILEKTFPEARCELSYHNEFELLCAVMLSAQTTDARVNSVTPQLFEKYPNAKALMRADVDDIEEIIKPVGLYHNKAKSLIALAKDINDLYDGIVPEDKAKLMKLNGVGNKTANVVMAEAFGEPHFAVDTHVQRTAKRLGFAKKEDDITSVEKKLMRAFEKDKWIKAHHLFIFFGRYMCKARSPRCEICPLISYCQLKK